MPSLGYQAGEAAKFLRSLQTVASLDFIERLDALKRGHGIATALCMAIGVSLDDVAAASLPPKAGHGPLVQLPEDFFTALDTSIAAVVRRKSRNEVRSRSTHGVHLVRIIAHIIRHDDASLFVQVAKAAAGGGVPSADLLAVPPLDDAGALPRTVTRPAKGRSLPEDEAIFRAILRTSTGIEATNSCLPHDFGLSLPGLKDLFAAVLGPVKERRGVKSTLIPHAPVHVTCDPAEWPAYASYLDGRRAGISVGTARPHGIPDDADDVVPGYLFPPVAWDLRGLDRYRFVRSDYEFVVETLRRKARDYSSGRTGEITSEYTYGVLRDVDLAVKGGHSVIVTGISGTGKSSLIKRLIKGVSGVFEIGTGSVGPGDGARVFRLSEVDRLLRTAIQVKGRKILVCHEFMLTPGLLCRLAIFDQLILVGDERQPGPTKDASHLFDFISAIGGKAFALSVIWRAANPCSLLVANYLGYGSRYVLSPRRVSKGSWEQFAALECDDDPPAIAACMLAYAAKKAGTGRHVTVAASDPEIVRSIEALVALSDERPSVDFRSLDDLQGRETDVLVVDLHDMATHVRTVREALRYTLMVLGRARITTCLLVGRRNAARDAAAALPIEVFMGVVLRGRAFPHSYIKGGGRAFTEMQRDCRLMRVDEETIAAIYNEAGLAGAMLIKSRRSHNAAMIEGVQALIEAPAFFDGTSDLDREYQLLGDYIRTGFGMRVGVHTWDDVERHIRDHPRNPGRPSTFET